MALTSWVRSTWAASGSSRYRTWTPHWTGQERPPGRAACRSRCARSWTCLRPDGAADVIEQAFRAEYGRAVAVLTRVLGSIDLAEDAVQEAFTVATERWVADGVPASPAGWIITTARNRAIDRLRRETGRADKHAQAALLHAVSEPLEVGPVQDDRLRLI